MLLFLDDDQTLPPDFFAIAHSIWEKQPDRISGICFSRRALFDDSTAAWLKQDQFYEIKPLGDRPLRGDLVTGGATLVRRRVFTGAKTLFDPFFGCRMQDNVFYQEATDRGECFISCSATHVLEYLPSSRTNVSYIIRHSFCLGMGFGFMKIRGKHPLKVIQFSVLSTAQLFVSLLLFFLALLRGRTRLLMQARLVARQLGKLSALCRCNLGRSH